MLIDPYSLRHDLRRLEEIEKASLRLVVQAIHDYRELAVEIFHRESDLVADIGEDITREALDRMGTAKIDGRLFGKIDYKRARYLFHPEYAVKQALFVDSKAEKTSGQRTATLQTSQFSMKVRQERVNKTVEVQGELPSILQIHGDTYITTTVFVKYNYTSSTDDNNVLRSITIAALPNGLLQERYNPSATDSIWLAGRNAPSRGEVFRVRLAFSKLKAKAGWRVQHLELDRSEFVWSE